MDPSSWSRDQTTVHEMETQGVPYSQEISWASISRRDHDNSVLGLRRCSAFGIYATQDYNYWRHLCFRSGGLRENIKQKLRKNLSAGVLLLHNNAPAHKSRTSRAAVRKCGFVELNHPPYSPDLALGDCILFRKLKFFLHRRRFPNDNAIKEAVTGYFDTQDV